jgi:L-asparaginase
VSEDPMAQDQVPEGRALPRVHVITLGGTIAMTAREDGEGVRPTLGADALLASVPGMPPVKAEVTAFRQVPGADLTLDDAVALARHIDELVADGCQGVVVTQGTDTLEEMAFALDLLCAADAPVVVTGALRNPGQAGADGPANLLAALRIAASPHAAGHGVLVTMNDEIHAARYVSKTHTSRPSAFTSAGAGPVGWIAEDRVRLPLRPSRRLHIPLAEGQRPAPVALVTAALGDDGSLLRLLPETGYRGAVVAAFGAGHLPGRMVDDVAALARRMPVVLASRTGAGEGFRATYGFAGSERALLAKGLIGAGGLACAKARVLLSLALGAGWPNGRLADAYEELTG